MVPVLTVIIIITISVLITKVATIALMHTGLSRQSARFQATTAFTGVGYATQEAENIVNHPLRRKIIMLLMLLGNAGIVSVMASLLLTFVGPQEHEYSLGVRLLMLGGGIVLLLVFFSSKLVNRGLSRIIHFALQKYTRLDVQDYSGLLHIAGGYEISEIFVEKDDWLAEKSLAELALPKEGLFILGINRKNGTYLGIPGHQTQICPGDTLIIYGRASAIKRINSRKKGRLADFERKLSEKENKQVRKEEQKKDIGTQQEKEKESISKS
ncbi:cation:proton antiporter regulatory subunit [Nafulsella turpanensis]|uniref:cation:proton antiporter regulatory subunit n=1 Tax=Nafulsella turpanensis TaxID=1265690 RepID=UPI00034C8671|nr:TrkA C-terminal domain-containing protein [Nafulsella turpanensis]